MPSSGRRRIGPVDTIWLNMDRPNNLMVIVSVLFLEGVPDWDEVTDVIRTRFVDSYPVFRQRRAAAHGLLGQPYWEDDPDFDLADHLHRATLPAPGDDRALQRYIEERVPLPLDPRHPLWEVHLVDGYGSGAALVLRAHHALADGIALARVLLSATEDERGTVGTDSGLVAAPEVAPGQGRSLVRGLVTGSFGLVQGSLVRGLHLLTPSGTHDAARLAVRTARVASDLLLSHNPDNAFGGAPGPQKRVVWTAPVPVSGLKQLGRLAGATLNDVVLSALAGALHTYQLDRGAAPVDLITMVPVNVRPLDRPLPRELGNQFALVFLKFPSALATPLARLAETKRRMDWLKASPEAVLTFGLISTIGRTGRALERPIVDFFANKAVGVTTNVAGPKSVRYLAGVPVTGVLGWVPGSGHHTLGVCVFTYAGTVRVGLLTDESVVSEPESLLAAFEDEVDTLVRIGRAATRRRRRGHADRSLPS